MAQEYALEHLGDYVAAMKLFNMVAIGMATRGAYALTSKNEQILIRLLHFYRCSRTHRLDRVGLQYKFKRKLAIRIEPGARSYLRATTRVLNSHHPTRVGHGEGR